MKLLNVINQDKHYKPVFINIHVGNFYYTQMHYVTATVVVYKFHNTELGFYDPVLCALNLNKSVYSLGSPK